MLPANLKAQAAARLRLTSFRTSPEAGRSPAQLLCPPNSELFQLLAGKGECQDGV